MKTKRNHYLSRFFSNNFRTEKGKPMWLLDCTNGKVTNRGTGEDSLFMKRRIWEQSLEDLFEQKIENNTKQLVDSVLNLPLNTVAGSFTVDRLAEKYSMLYTYQMQSIMLQLSNRDKAQSQVNDEHAVARVLHSNMVPPCNHPFLIRFNHVLFADKPLVLIDNAVSAYVTPPLNSNSAGSICFFMPISPYSLIFFGSSVQLECFLFSKRYPHAINIYRILQEDKQCLVASQNETYIRWLATKCKYKSFSSKAVVPKSNRNFI